MWSLVFLSNPASPDIAERLPNTEHVAAFMPCTPNPTTGFFFYVPRRDIIDLDITVEAAMTLLMSAGMAQPGEQQKKLATLGGVRRSSLPLRRSLLVEYFSFCARRFVIIWNIILANGEIQERVLTKQDLREAHQIYLINSVRKWIHAELVDL